MIAPKFRIWDIEKKEFIGILHLEKLGTVYTYKKTPGRQGYLWSQSIGREDKNGADVYDGDILKWSNDLYECRWDELTCGFKLFWNEDPKQRHLDFEEFEIVGNIFENQELLAINDPIGQF